MKLSEIKKMPTVFNNVHDSIYRHYHILNYVLGMVERGDSKETIKEVAEYLKEDGIDENIK